MEQVLPGVAIPVILTHLLEPVRISSTISADTKFSLVKWSREAMGRQPRVLQRKSTSSLSISLTTMIFILSKKWVARSERASLKIDFWIRRTLHPAFLICLTMLRMYALSSLNTLSMAEKSDTTTWLSMSVLGGETQNWMNPILAFSHFLGPLILAAFCSNTNPSTSSVSSTVPPGFLIILISLRLTLFSLTGSTILRTASTAMGESSALFWDTTLEQREVLAAFRRDSLSERSSGVAIAVKISTDFTAAFWKLSEMVVGWIPLIRSLSAASRRLPAITTTEVVPSPASISWALLSSTNILAAGWTTFIWFRMVAPSLVMVTSLLASWIILSMPLGPRLVLTASDRALAAWMLLLRISSGLEFFDFMSPARLTSCFSISHDSDADLTGSENIESKALEL